MPEPAERPSPASLPGHGAAALPAVQVDAYNAELKTPEGFLGDRASNRAFRAILDQWRALLRKAGEEDPLGEAEHLSRKQLDRLLTEGDAEAAGLVHTVVEDFARSLAGVLKRLLKLKEWRDTERVVVGGGLRASRVGELAIARTELLLKAEGLALDLQPIRHHPDEAGMLGATQLAPPWIFKGHDALLAVDIGGSNIRAGIVEPRLAEARDLSAARMEHVDLWRHAEDKPRRDEAIERLGEMLRGLVKRAEKRGLHLAPFIGVGCPGRIEPDGGIAQGAQNLPGNWESSRFNLPRCIMEAVPGIGGHPPMVVVHNDAVVQGLSEVPFQQDVARWGVLTIGTGLGNARFTNRRDSE